jgi:Thrombospondin type 3 repeat/FG-GAP-like repeat
LQQEVVVSVSTRSFQVIACTIALLPLPRLCAAQTPLINAPIVLGEVGDGGFASAGQVAAVGDMDGDGATDVIVDRGTGADLDVWSSDGAGQFALSASLAHGLPSGAFTGPDSSRPVAVGDVDGDGDLDVAACVFDYTTYTVRVALFRGDGVWLADLDGDGNLDLLVGGSVLLGDGSGDFIEVGFASWDEWWNTVLGDIDGDGAMDLVKPGSVAFGDGAGGFEPATSTGGQCPGYYYPTLHDLDLDGNLDLVVALDREINVCLGDGAGSFEATSSYRIGAYVGPSAVGDFDGDGHLDLATSNSVEKLFVLSGDRTGAFGAGTWDAAAGGFSHWGAVGVSAGIATTNVRWAADTDGDGDDDLVAQDGGYTAIYRQTTPAIPPVRFDEPVVVGEHGEYGFASAGQVVAVGDMDGDGTTDLIVDRGTGADLDVWLSDGAGQHTLSASLAHDLLSGVFTGPDSSRPVAVGDVDGDGDLDVAACVFDDTTYLVRVALFRGDGTGSFAPVELVDSNGGEDAIWLDDLNGDGNLDLLAGGSVLLGDGSGDFLEVGFVSWDEWWNTALGDIDGDGAMDLVKPGFVALGDGAGGFGPETSNFNQCPGYYAPTLHDLDLDGNLDLMVALDREITVCLGDGAGAFVPTSSYYLGEWAGPSAAGDFNGDGYPDLAVGDSAERLFVLSGDGTGGFGAGTWDAAAGRFTHWGAVSLSAGIAYTDVLWAADVDGDGDDDLVVQDAAGYTSVYTWSPADADGDAVANDADNCPSTYNPDQLDTDADGGGDVCDPYPADATNTDTDALQSDASGTIGASGGTLANASGAFSVTYDAGVLSEDTTVTVVEQDADELAEIAAVENAVALAVYDVLGVSVPALITICVDAAAVTDPSALFIAIYDEPAQQWLALDTSVSTVGPDVCATATVPHTSFVALFESVPDTDGDGVTDHTDVCPGYADSDDVDEDGAPDGCDPCPVDPHDDSDDDGSCDSDDLCPGQDDALDEDGDGVPDDCDACPVDYYNDSDGDGSCNVDDVCPFDADDDNDDDGVCGDEDVCAGGDDGVDSDLDGVPDDCDTCPSDAANDADGDGVCGDADACPGGDNNLDADGDGTADFCDVCPYDDANDADDDGRCADDDICPLDEADDADGDGVCGDEDICALGDDDADADDDGVPDECDPCPLDVVNDADGDGICESDDNCPMAANSNQQDTDGDGVGDVCEPDADADGITDDLDNCPLDSNATQADADADGMGDPCDADDDGDGVLDGADGCAETADAAVVDLDGCSVEQDCPCSAAWKNHGAYVSCVARSARELVAHGVVTGTSQNALVSAAAASTCGQSR